jgi:hypothetical protein
MLFDKNLWRARSRPFLDGSQGEILSDNDCSLHLPVPFEPNEAEFAPHEPNTPDNVQLTERKSPELAFPSKLGHAVFDAHGVAPAHQPRQHGTTVAKCEATTDALSQSTYRTAPLQLLSKADDDRPRRFTWTNPFHAPRTTGLDPPRLNVGTSATGVTTAILRLENKRRQKSKQRGQHSLTVWHRHHGNTRLPVRTAWRPTYRNSMCPAGVALLHPAAPLLLDYATTGCPVNTSEPWSRHQIVTALRRGPHISALAPDALEQFNSEIDKKVAAGQARLVVWDTIKHHLPRNLKISPIAMVPHKSRAYRAILDLSFGIRLPDGSTTPSVNATTVKTVPKGAVDQLGHVLTRIIHAFADPPSDAPIYMAKWDIKDGFWRLDCKKGQEWNFTYILPSSHVANPKNPTLVVPTSLQMGWIESPAYFCTASETARDVATLYMESAIGSLPHHKFCHYTQVTDDYLRLPTNSSTPMELWYMLEDFVDDFIGLAIPQTRVHLDHVATGTMMGIHDVFPPNNINTNDPISETKLRKGDGAWATTKELLGLTFDGTNRTVWLSTEKRNLLLNTLTGWLRRDAASGMPFDEFQSTLSKLQHAFITIPAGRGLLSPFYRVLGVKPLYVHLTKNAVLCMAVADCRTFLRESVSSPTACKNLVSGWPDFVGITDASAHGLGGVIVGELRAVPPTVFRLKWPESIRNNIVSADNPEGTITNSDLEMAGLFMLWLVMEDVCNPLTNAHVALFSDNSPTVHWVQRLAAKHSTVAMQLVRALALRLQLQHTSPLTPLHIAGKKNALTDIPSRSFGSEPTWFCESDTDLSTLFNASFPLPNQASWTVYQPSSKIATRLISTLQTKVFTLDEWRRLPTPGRNIGPVGEPMLHLWDWTRTCTIPRTCTKHAPSLAMPPEFEADTTGEDTKFALGQSLWLSRPLERRFPWPQE